MTHKQTLIRLFSGQEIERVPIWLLNPYHKVDYYTDIYCNPNYKRLIPYIEKYCITLDRRNYGSGIFYNGNPDIERVYSTYEKDGNTYNQEQITYKDFKLTGYVRTGKDATYKKYLVDDIDTLEDILSIPYKPVKADFSLYEKEKAELGDRGLMMMDLGDPLAPLYHMMSAEDFSICTLTDYDKMLDFLDVIYERVYDLYKYYLENGIGDVFFIVGAEFAGPPLVSPSKFCELSVKYVKGIVDLIRSYGKFSIVHYHGFLYQVLDGFAQIGMDGLHTIEAPPVGDCTIKQAREKLGDTILIGNIQYDDLTRLEPEQIKQLTKEALEQGKSGRFILSPTAGPYENNPSDRLVDNYITMIKTALEYGKL